MIDIPDDKPPWRAGYEARRASKGRNENPFDVRDARLLLWDDGWLFADTEINADHNTADQARQRGKTDAMSDDCPPNSRLALSGAICILAAALV